MKYLFLSLLALLLSVSSMAQSYEKSLKEYKQKQQRSYMQYRDNYMKSFNAYLNKMRQSWEEFKAQAPLEKPKRKEPVLPINKRPGINQTKPIINIVKDDNIYKLTIPFRKNIYKKINDTVVAPKEDISKDTISCYHHFSFYGTPCSVSLKDDNKFHLRSIKENDVADAWKQFSNPKYRKIFEECKLLKNNLCLNDWGFYELLKKMGDSFYGVDSNESVLFQTFIMFSSGYQIRLARGNNHLCLLLNSEDSIYERSYFNIDNNRFYLMDKRFKSVSCSICNFKILDGNPMDMNILQPPHLSYIPSPQITHANSTNTLSIKISVNANLMDFYQDYPPCYWSVYAATNITDEVKSQLYPEIEKLIEGNNNYESANIILHFLHQNFKYKVDADQFGGERTLFAEETLFYPYCDCEDRSILYAKLVQDLLHLKVVLLHYPNHIATAICFNQDTPGDKLLINDSYYVISDPTYIGSNVGDVMPSFRNVTPKVVSF